eukprot:scaffold122938_cov17-Prasinocladus_malaysianus.AAC.2
MTRKDFIAAKHPWLLPSSATVPLLPSQAMYLPMTIELTSIMVSHKVSEAAKSTAIYIEYHAGP